MEEIFLAAKDGYQLCLHIFAVEQAKGYVQIIHGMEEHQERYEPLVAVLNDAGYTVVSSDMRGHGKDAPLLGFFQKKNGYRYLLSDQKRISNYIRERFHAKRVMLFAHSMGTILARNLLQSESHNYEKVILSGYPAHPGRLAIGTGLVLTGIISKWKGPEYFSKWIQNISVGTFNRKVANPKTAYDWISYNEENVQAFIEDPYCGHGFRISAFQDLFILTDCMNRVERYQAVRKKLPILMMRGEQDASTGFEKGSCQSKKVLAEAGFTNVKDIVYPDMRHEILNETAHEKVYADILSFLEADS